MDLAGRAPFLAAHYGDAGMLPREELSHASLHALSGSVWWEAALFALAAALALMLLAGVHARFAAAASWVLLVSLHLRNPLVLTGGDRLLALLLFWAMFLPLSSRGRGSVASLASAGLLLQVALVYAVTAIAKDPVDWWIEGSAARHALEIDALATPFGRSLLAYPDALVWASRATLALEVLAPLAALLPRLRAPIAAAMVAFHLALATVLEVGLFPWVCIAGWIAFYPAAPATSFERRPIAAGAALAFVLVLALGAPGPLRRAGVQLGLQQDWAMFASPPRRDGWWVAPALLADGSEVDLITGKPMARGRPESVAALYPSHRVWRALSYLAEPEDHPKIHHYARWMRGRWDAEHDATRRVRALKMLFVVEEAGSRAPPVAVVMYRSPELSAAQ